MKKKLNVTITPIENRNGSENVERPLAGWCCSCCCCCIEPVSASVAAVGSAAMIGSLINDWTC